MKKLFIILLSLFLLSSCSKTDDILKEPISNEENTSQNQEIVDNNSEQEEISEPKVDDFNEELGVGINSNNFPDKYFRLFVHNHYDVDSNYYLSTDEIESVIDFNCEEEVEDFDKIKDLTGIQMFTNISFLCISKSDYIDSFDFKPFNKLERVTLSSSKINDVDFSKNPNLVFLRLADLSVNSLTLHGIISSTEIDIENMIIDNDMVFSLDVTDCEFYNNPLNILKDVSFPVFVGEEYRPTKVIKNNEVIIYDTGDSIHDYYEGDKEGINFKISNKIYYLGQGKNKIVETNTFKTIEEAFEYGLSGDSWFRIVSVFYDDTPLLFGGPIDEENDEYDNIDHSGFEIKLVDSPFN